MDLFLETYVPNRALLPGKLPVVILALLRLKLHFPWVVLAGWLAAICCSKRPFFHTSPTEGADMPLKLHPTPEFPAPRTRPTTPWITLPLDSLVFRVCTFGRRVCLLENLPEVDTLLLGNLQSSTKPSTVGTPNFFANLSGFQFLLSRLPSLSVNNNCLKKWCFNYVYSWRSSQDDSGDKH